METIKGLPIKDLGFTPKKMGDFLYYEGPLLSHFVDESNHSKHYFYRWVDCDDDTNRWLVFSTFKNDLIDFFNKSISLKEMITKNSSVILIDFDDDLLKKQILITTIEELPPSYLPADASHYQERFYRKYARQLKEELENEVNQQNLLILLLKKVQQIDKQQRKTNWLVSELLSIREEDNNNYSDMKKTIYQDELLNSLVNQ